VVKTVHVLPNPSNARRPRWLAHVLRRVSWRQ
jgi:hypothetical protein